MAEIVTPIPTGPLIPQEYQQQIDDARRKQMIAQMLMSQSMNNKGPQQIGPVAAKISPLAGLASLAQTGLGGYMDATAATDASSAKSRFETDQAASLAKAYALPEEQQPQALIQDKFPQNQSIGRALQAQNEKRREELAKIAGQAGDAGGAAGILTGVTPMKGYTPKTYPDPEIVDRPDPNDPSGVRKVSYIKSYDKNGRMTLAPASSMSQTVNLPGAEGPIALKREQDDLATKQSQASSAMRTLATTDQAIQALQAGASTGGLAGSKQAIRKIMLGLGVPADQLPESGPTDVAKQIFGRALAEHAKTFGSQPTEAEDKRIAELVGTIDTDPNAMPQLLAYMTASAHKSLQDFGDFLKIKRTGPAAKTYPGLYDTADVGIRTPDKLSGPKDFQYRVIEALKQGGGDITRFQDTNPLTGRMEPIPADASFSLKNSPIAPPVAPTVAPTPVARPKIKMPDGSFQQLNAAGTGWEPVK